VAVDSISTDDSETQALALIFASISSREPDRLCAALEDFIAASPHSPWTPSLRINLGKYYRNNGQYSLAFQHWAAAWEATQEYARGPGKHVADYALAHWTRLLVSLGQLDTLQRVFIETKGRVLDGGPLTQMFLRTQEAYYRIQRHPAAAYKCGLWALNYVARRMYGSNYNSTGLLGGPEEACSLRVLAALADELKLGLVPVRRLEGDEIVVPCVAHLKLNHYIAILSRRGDCYEVADPTFGHVQFFRAKAINGELSGYFMIPAGKIPVSWQSLTPEQSSIVRGRSLTFNPDDPIDQPCVATTCPSNCPTGKGGTWGGAPGPSGFPGAPGVLGGGCIGCQVGFNLLTKTVGMPVWRVSEPYINLWLLRSRSI
ncbi:MAG: cysteine peptidase family C39 domain-containing protein, partial [Candidatus Omnitrophica bacterium]|nr:cysteine peptidase family C39 domain-containing protein [Candidatus Omnitrophota bacterium]